MVKRLSVKVTEQAVKSVHLVIVQNLSNLNTPQSYPVNMVEKFKW